MYLKYVQASPLNSALGGGNCPKSHKKKYIYIYSPTKAEQGDSDYTHIINLPEIQLFLMINEVDQTFWNILHA